MFEGDAVKTDTKKKAHARLRRVGGQVEGIQRMLDDDRYCVDILLQIAAARAALDQAGKLILASHVETCVADAFASGKRRDRDKKLAELMKVFSRFGYVNPG